MATDPEPTLSIAKGKTALGLPYSLRACFQEYDIDELDLKRDQSLIIERVLAYGNRVEVRWLLATFGQKEVVRWLEQSGRRLPRRRCNLWCTLFQVSPAAKPTSDHQPIWPY